MKMMDEDKPYDEINVVPMLDLAYVLLVIFMIMTTVAIQGVEVNLPKASKSPDISEQRTKAIVVAADGTIFLDTFPVSLEELEARLRQAQTTEGDFPVVVKGDGDAAYQQVIDVIDLLSRMDITKIGLATKPFTSGA